MQFIDPQQLRVQSIKMGKRTSDEKERTVMGSDSKTVSIDQRMWTTWKQR